MTARSIIISTAKQSDDKMASTAPREMLIFPCLKLIRTDPMKTAAAPNNCKGAYASRKKIILPKKTNKICVRVKNMNSDKSRCFSAFQYNNVPTAQITPLNNNAAMAKGGGAGVNFE